MNEQDKLIAEQIKTLPPELQSAIEAVPWRNLAKEISNTNGLSVEQQESFEQETMFVIYGFENPNDYVSNMARELGVSEDTANILANLAAEKIFNPIIERVGGRDTSSVPEIAPEIHPMVEAGEVAHNVPRTEEPVMILNKKDAEQMTKQPDVSLPDYRYPTGKDPYREPLK